MVEKEKSNSFLTVPLCEFTAKNPTEMQEQMLTMLPGGTKFESAQLIGGSVFLVFSERQTIKQKKGRG